MIEVKYVKEDNQFPIHISKERGFQRYTKKAACELNRKLAKAIHKMIEAE